MPELWRFRRQTKDSSAYKSKVIATLLLTRACGVSEEGAYEEMAMARSRNLSSTCGGREQVQGDYFMPLESHLYSHARNATSTACDRLQEQASVEFNRTAARPNPI
jgi:hypothetical protein